MENPRFFPFVTVLLAYISFTTGGLLLKDFISPDITEHALASATRKLEVFSGRSGARVRRATGDAKFCDDKMAECHKDVLAVDPADRTCIDIRNGTMCIFDLFMLTDACESPSGVATAKFIVSSYLQGFLSVSCKPNAKPEKEASPHKLLNQCADKYYAKVMRTDDPAAIADAVCCGNVELARCLSSNLDASLKSEFVESSYKKFLDVSRAPEYGFEGCDKLPLEKCTK